MTTVWRENSWLTVQPKCEINKEGFNSEMSNNLRSIHLQFSNEKFICSARFESAHHGKTVDLVYAYFHEFR